MANPAFTRLPYETIDNNLDVNNVGFKVGAQVKDYANVIVLMPTSSRRWIASCSTKKTVLRVLCKFESGSRRGRRCRRQTHQFVVVRRPRAHELRNAPPLALECLVLRLLVCHELQPARHCSHRRAQVKSPVKPALVLAAEYRAESTCGAHSQ
jgi:hypothetical protein